MVVDIKREEEKKTKQEKAIAGEDFLDVRERKQEKYEGEERNEGKKRDRNGCRY